MQRLMACARPMLCRSKRIEGRIAALAVHVAFGCWAVENVWYLLGLGRKLIVKGCKRLPSCAPAACVSVAVEH